MFWKVQHIVECWQIRYSFYGSLDHTFDFHFNCLYQNKKLIDGHGFKKLRMIFVEETDSESDETFQSVFWSGASVED